MKNRVMAGVAALVVVVALVALALAAGRDSGSDTPAALPILGAGGERAAASMVAGDAAIMPAWQIDYVAGDGLPALDGEERAWVLEPGEVDDEQVAAIEDALDVGGSREVTVQDVAGHPWSMYDEKGQDVAVSSGVAVACAPDTECPEPEPLPEPERPADLPTKDEAEQIGRDLLEQLGVDLDEATVRVEDGFSVWNVSADPEVGGLPTVGMTTSLGIGPKGEVLWASGWLDDPEEGDTYPLIGTAAAIDRLNEQQVGILGAATDVVADDGREPALGAPECLECPEPEPKTVTITGARLALQLYGGWTEDTPAYLVPSYLMTGDDGSELPVLAVADTYLEPIPQPEPEPVPEPRPTEPGGGGSSGSGSGSAGESCQAADGPDMSAELCGPTELQVGEVAAFRLLAKGPVRDDCGSPIPEWGDDSSVAVCDIGCESTPPNGSVERTFEHAYAEPGTYTVTFRFVGCGPDYGDQMTLTTEVHVTE